MLTAKRGETSDESIDIEKREIKFAKAPEQGGP
jgi:hypothetical protein